MALFDLSGQARTARWPPGAVTEGGGVDRVRS